jgi:hypothetical protein
MKIRLAKRLERDVIGEGFTIIQAALSQFLIDHSIDREVQSFQRYHALGFQLRGTLRLQLDQTF